MKRTILLTILLVVIPCSAAIITVEPDGSGDVPTIQEAVDTAVVGDEIVLAIGTYTGDGNRDIDFKGKAITVRGNIADPNLVVIDCQGTEEEPHRGFSFTSGEDANSIVSGLTVTNGYGPDEEFIGSYEYSVGGAIYCHSSSPTITNCTFSGNSADRWGGGMGNFDNSSPTVTYCTFTGNSADSYGGGISNWVNSSPTLTNCTFTGNSARIGGGMDNYDNSSPTVTNCTFTGNSADRDGGGMRNIDSSPTITNCAFSGNMARWGGGMCNDSDSSPTVDSCTFSGNSAEWGGGMCNWICNPTVTNCTFTGNSAGYGGAGGGGMYNQWGRPTVTNCTFTDNSARIGGGMFNWDSSPTVTNCTFTGNSASSSGGGMLNQICNPTVTNCTFTSNSAEKHGGGMLNYASSLAVTNCTFTGNTAVETGGGMYNDRSRSLTVTNCTFTGNSAGGGGGMENGGGWVSNEDSTVTNCTFIGNTAVIGGGMSNGDSWTVTNCTFIGNLADSGGGMYNSSYLSSPTVTNCILWANSPEQVYAEEGSSPVITYSDIQGGWEGEGNININPNFVDPDGPDGVLGTEDDNLHLMAGSPCIDAGDNNAVPPEITTDLDGNPRIISGVVDMGAYEFNHIPVADAGPDQTVYACVDGIAEVTLDGSGSFDSDGDLLEYFWFNDANELIAEGVDPNVILTAGEHVIELIVNDGIEDSEPNEVVITVIEPIEADLYIAPKVINRSSRGISVVAIITLPEGIGEDDIDVDVVFTLFPGEIAAETQLVREIDDIVKVFALFNKSDLMDAVAADGEVELTIVGKLKSGQCVYGADSVRIIQPRQRLQWQRRNSHR